jgi:hypothetical protein
MVSIISTQVGYIISQIVLDRLSHYAKVVGSIADGRTVTVRMRPGADKATELRIKTSKFGNEERSRVIYGKIQQNLKGISG